MKRIEVHRDNLAKHGVSPEEARECFHSRRPTYLRKARRDVFQLIAQTSSGRYLELLFEKRLDAYWVFHGMDARPFQIMLLKRKGKRR